MFQVSRIFFILILVFLVCSNPQDRVAKTHQAIQQIMLDFATSPIVHMLLIYDSSLMGANIVQALDHIATKKKGYLQIKIIDCNTKDQKVLTQFAYCTEQTRKQLPALIFNQPHLNLNNDGELIQPRIKPYEGNLDEKKLYNFAVPLMQTYSIELKNQRDLKKFQESYPQTPKIIYFSDKQKIPPFFKALTANFRHTIAFAHCFSKSPLTQIMKIDEFPTFLLLRSKSQPETIPIQKDINKMIQRLKTIEGQATDIHIHQYKNSKLPELNPQNFDKLVLEKQQSILIHVPSQNGDEHKQWVNAMKKFKRMFKFYEILAQDVSKKIGVKQTPAIVYYPKSLAKKNVQKTVFYPSDTLDNIYNEIDSLVDDFTLPLADQIEMQKLISLHLQQEKLVAILFHEQQRSLAYKVISNDDHLEEHIAFFRMKDPKPQILQQFQVKKLPALIMLMQDKQSEQKIEISEQEKAQGKAGFNLKIAQYTGRFNYAELFDYFNNFVKMPSSSQQSYENQDVIDLDSELVQIKSPQIFQKTCLSEGCFLLLVNDSPNNKAKTTAGIQMVSKQAQKIPRSKFAYLDGVCHSEILGQLQIMEDEMPVLLYINSKFEKYSRMIGRLEPTAIRNFISKSRANKGAFRGYDKLKLLDKNCEQQHKKIQQLSQGNIQLSEEQAAIIEQLKQKEEQKRSQFKQSVQKDKVRKKGKKRRPKKEYDQEL